MTRLQPDLILWRITIDDGRQFIVEAPTKSAAIKICLQRFDSDCRGCVRVTETPPTGSILHV